MTQPRHDADHDPPVGKDADVIEFKRTGPEHAHDPEAAIEHFLLSNEGRLEMSQLYRKIDESGHIIKTLNFEIGETFRNQDPTIYALFIHDDGGQGLTRPELVKLYKDNPLLNATLRSVQRKHHTGDLQAQQMYTFGMRIFTNMVRYEWLLGDYDPDDPRWEDRAMRLGDVHGGEIHMNLQPAHGRRTVVPRHNTPSDYLESSR